MSPESWLENSCGEKAKGWVCFSPARQGYPNPGHHPQPPGNSHNPLSLPIQASQTLVQGKNYLLFKNTEREKLSSGFLEILRQKNKHSSRKSVVVLKSVCQEIAVQNKKEQKLFIEFTSWCGAWTQLSGEAGSWHSFLAEVSPLSPGMFLNRIICIMHRYYM